MRELRYLLAPRHMRLRSIVFSQEPVTMKRSCDGQLWWRAHWRPDPRRHAKPRITAHSHWVVERAVWRYGHLIHRILNAFIIVQIYFNMVIQAVHIHSRCVKVAKLIVVTVAVCCLDQGPELKIWTNIPAGDKRVIKQKKHYQTLITRTNSSWVKTKCSAQCRLRT